MFLDVLEVLAQRETYTLRNASVHLALDRKPAAYHSHVGAHGHLHDSGLARSRLYLDLCHEEGVHVIRVFHALARLYVPWLPVGPVLSGISCRDTFSYHLIVASVGAVLFPHGFNESLAGHLDRRTRYD